MRSKRRARTEGRVPIFYLTQCPGARGPWTRLDKELVVELSQLCLMSDKLNGHFDSCIIPPTLNNWFKPMARKLRAIVIEDTPADVIKAVQMLGQLGIQEPTIFTDIGKAMLFLEGVAAGVQPCPDLILLDLGLGMDSGFEALRFFKTNAQIQRCNVIVWTVMGENHKELCKYLGAKHVVSKLDGESALLMALSDSTASFNLNA